MTNPRSEYVGRRADPKGLMNRRSLDLSMSIERIAVLGAGQMGNGITQVAACAGYEVTMIDLQQDYVDNGLANIQKSLQKIVSKERPWKNGAKKTFPKENRETV